MCEHVTRCAGYAPRQCLGPGATTWSLTAAAAAASSGEGGGGCVEQLVTQVLRSTGNPKSDVEWKMYTAAKLPGPGQYEVPTGIQALKGGKFR
jgi:hypothetical protein